MKTYKLYDLISGIYDRCLISGPLRKTRLQEKKVVLSLLQENISSEDNVIELGAGTGYYTHFLGDISRKITAVDLSYGMISHLTKKLDKTDNVRLEVKDINSIASFDGYDAVVGIGIAEHIDMFKLVSTFQKSDTSKAVFTFPTKCLNGYCMKFFYNLFGVSCKLYDERDISDKLDNYNGLAAHIYNIGNGFLKHHTKTIFIEKVK